MSQGKCSTLPRLLLNCSPWWLHTHSMCAWKTGPRRSIYFIFALFRKSVNVRQTERWRLFTDLQGTVHTARGVPVKKVAVSVQDVRRPPRHTPREQGQQITLIAWKECVFCLIVYSFPARKDYGLHWMNIGICWPLFILLVGWFGRFFIAHWI